MGGLEEHGLGFSCGDNQQNTSEMSARVAAMCHNQEAEGIKKRSKQMWLQNYITLPHVQGSGNHLQGQIVFL